MHAAIAPNTHPARPPARLVAALVLGLAALPMSGFAHEQVDHQAAASAGVPRDDAVSLQVRGRVDAIVVSSRVTGQTQRFPILEADDGQRYLLKNADGLPAGAAVAIAGRVDGRTLYSESASMLAPVPAAKAAPQRRELTGTLRMFHVDYGDGRPAEFGYSLVADTGEQAIVDLGTLLPMLENGARATVSGPTDAGGHISVDTIEILGPPEVKPRPKAGGPSISPAAVTTGYIVLPIKFPSNSTAPFTYNADPASWPISTITSTVFGTAPVKSIAEFYKEVSFGAQLLSGTVANSGGNWLQATVARPTACGTSAALTDVLNTINSQGAALADTSGYTGILYVLDALPCGWLGLGYIGWERAYAKGTASLLVVGHEFGHNFGLYHAGSLDCGTAEIATTGCTVTEYGDPFDIMGNNRAMHFAAYQKQLLGYIPGSFGQDALRGQPDLHARPDREGEPGAIRGQDPHRKRQSHVLARVPSADRLRQRDCRRTPISALRSGWRDRSNGTTAADAPVCTTTRSSST